MKGRVESVKRTLHFKAPAIEPNQPPPRTSMPGGGASDTVRGARAPWRGGWQAWQPLWVRGSRRTPVAAERTFRLGMASRLGPPRLGGW